METAEEPLKTMRPVLGLDTCGAETTLALANCGADTLAVMRAVTLGPRTAAAEIVTALDEVLGETFPQALRAIVVVRGPGSFTGMRIGLSCAKALAAATGVPLLGVSRLGVLAECARAPWAALDAGRGNLFLRESVTEEEQMVTADAARALMPRELWPHVAVCEAKTAAVFLNEISLSQDDHRELPLHPAPDAVAAIRYALPRLAAEDWDDAESLDALYLWREEQMFAKPSARP